jgi:hypothetical protein
MLEVALTKHAKTRMRQRGFQGRDLALLLSSATEVAPDAYLLTRADANREIGESVKFNSSNDFPARRSLW